MTEPAAVRTPPGLPYVLGLGVGTLGTLITLASLWTNTFPAGVIPAGVTTLVELALLGVLYLVVLRRISPAVILVPLIAGGMIIAAAVGFIVTVTVNALASIAS